MVKLIDQDFKASLITMSSAVKKGVLTIDKHIRNLRRKIETTWKE